MKRPKPSLFAFESRQSAAEQDNISAFADLLQATGIQRRLHKREALKDIPQVHFSRKTADWAYVSGQK